METIRLVLTGLGIFSLVLISLLFFGLFVYIINWFKYKQKKY